MHESFAVIEAVAATAKKPRRGRKRDGAGRKPFLKNAGRLTVSLEGSDYEAVEELATKRGVSISAVIRDAVRAYVVKRRA